MTCNDIKNNQFQPKPENQNGFPNPIQVQCFECSKAFWIRFVVPSRDYSKKNNWGYYTGKEEDEDKYKCNSCLHSLYYNKPIFWKSITDLKSRKKLSSYVSSKLV